MLLRTAKSCGPDAPTLASSLAEFASAQPGGSALPHPLWERVGVRGYGLTIDRNPSPGSHLAMRSDLSHKGRGDTEPTLDGGARTTCWETSAVYSPGTMLGPRMAWRCSGRSR